MRWTAAFTYLSIAALAGAVVSQALGSADSRGWCLLAWCVLLLPVAIGLLGHPMRAAAWGLFAGFWGVVAVLILIVLQALAVADVIRGAAAGPLTSMPLAVIGAWFLIASALGFGESPFPSLVDLLGLLAGAGLIAISVTTWSGDSDLLRAAGVAAAVAYVLWAAGAGWVFFGLARPYQRTRGVATAR